MRFVECGRAGARVLAVTMVCLGVFAAGPVLAKKKTEAPPAPPPMPRHALSFETPAAYPQGFGGFQYTSRYAEPDGRLVVGETGTYDGFNPFVVGSRADARLYSVEGPFESYVFESLMVRGRDEPGTLYGLIATSVTLSADETSATFVLNPSARFSDGRPVTPADVAFSAQAMRAHGPGRLQADLGRLISVTAKGDREVVFQFEPGAGRSALIAAALMPVLPKHVYEARGFGTESAMKPPVGTGPYVIASHTKGREIVYGLRKDYWAKTHPARRGHFNFGEVVVRYYPDRETHFAAFQAGDVQIWIETNPIAWEEAFSFYNARSGLIYREEFAYGGRQTVPGAPVQIDRIARWVDIERPQRSPRYGALIDTWWSAYTN